MLLRSWVLALSQLLAPHPHFAPASAARRRQARGRFAAPPAEMLESRALLSAAAVLSESSDPIAVAENSTGDACDTDSGTPTDTCDSAPTPTASPKPSPAPEASKPKKAGVDPATAKSEKKEADGTAAITFVTEGDGLITGTAAKWNWAAHKDSITLDETDTDWKKLNEWLEKINDGSLVKVTIGGHGGPHGIDPINAAALENPNSEASKFLTQLKEKMADDGIITFKGCGVCQNEDGRKFATKVALMTDSNVVGYTDTYAVTPYGDEYTARPDGTIEKTAELGAYRDAWYQRMRIWFNGGADADVKKAEKKAPPSEGKDDRTVYGP